MPSFGVDSYTLVQVTDLPKAFDTPISGVYKSTTCIGFKKLFGVLQILFHIFLCLRHFFKNLFQFLYNLFLSFKWWKRNAFIEFSDYARMRFLYPIKSYFRVFE